MCYDLVNPLWDLPGVSTMGGLSPASAPLYIPQLAIYNLIITKCSLGGAKYTKFPLCGNHRQCRTMLCLNLDTFKLLESKLSTLDNQPVSKIEMEEQLAMFIYIFGQSASNRQTQDCFQHSGETISRIFHHIISLLIKLVLA